MAPWERDDDLSSRSKYTEANAEDRAASKTATIPNAKFRLTPGGGSGGGRAAIAVGGAATCSDLGEVADVGASPSCTSMIPEEHGSIGYGRMSTDRFDGAAQ